MALIWRFSGPVSKSALRSALDLMYINLERDERAKCAAKRCHESKGETFHTSPKGVGAFSSFFSTFLVSFFRNRFPPRELKLCPATAQKNSPGRSCPRAQTWSGHLEGWDVNRVEREGVVRNFGVEILGGEKKKKKKRNR
jgi:hypothetical protein